MAKDIYKDMRIANDECYTTINESDKLINFLIENQILKTDMIVWCPFDNDFSNIYKSLQKLWGGVIIISNLEMGLDFYNYEPKKWDIIITNPPFSGRTKLMNRLISFDKPFIILQATQMFNNQYAVNYLCEYSNEFKFIMPRSRMSFLTYKKNQDIISSSRNGASFYSFWLCYKTTLKNTFTKIADSGKEKEIEKYDKKGNLIIDNHLNLFNYEK